MSALEEFPGELHLFRIGDRWKLIIADPDLRGSVSSTSRETVLAIAEVYAAIRRDQAVTS